jgi:hypothetical protein
MGRTEHVGTLIGAASWLNRNPCRDVLAVIGDGAVLH